MEGSASVRILGATAYPVNAASARVRVAQFAPFLRPYGVELEYEPALSPAEYTRLSSAAPAAAKASVLAASSIRAARVQRDGRLLLVHRLRLLNPVPFLDPPGHLDAYDFDDDLFEGSAAVVNRRYQWAKRESSRALACVRRARLVIAGNAFLAGLARAHNPHVEVVPSCVDPAAQPRRDHRPAEVVTIGWIGSHTTAVYLEPLLPVMDRINGNRLRARLVVVGGQLDYQAPWLEQRPWSLQRQAEDLSGFDIGLMPLPDTDWARGKCGYKLLQYFSAGTPAVASPVGVSTTLIGDDRGILAVTPEDWRRALERLIDDPAERSQRGAAARRLAEEHYSYAKWAPALGEMLRALG